MPPMTRMLKSPSLERPCGATARGVCQVMNRSWARLASFWIVGVVALQVGLATGCRNAPPQDLQKAPDAVQSNAGQSDTVHPNAGQSKAGQSGTAQLDNVQPNTAQAPPASAGQGGSTVTPPTLTLSDRAVFDVAGRQVVITNDDALAIRAALTDRLNQSDIPYKETLLDRTRDAPITIQTHLVRIGQWVLGESQGRLKLTYREQSDGPVTFFYQAEATNEAGRWKVGELKLGEMRRGR